MAKFKLEIVPPFGPIDPVAPELEVDELDELDELLDVGHELGLGGAWHLLVSVLHHQPP
jgi:hypothetical protein